MCYVNALCLVLFSILKETKAVESDLQLLRSLNLYTVGQLQTLHVRRAGFPSVKCFLLRQVIIYEQLEAGSADDACLSCLQTHSVSSIAITPSEHEAARLWSDILFSYGMTPLAQVNSSYVIFQKGFSGFSFSPSLTLLTLRRQSAPQSRRLQATMWVEVIVNRGI